MARPLRLQLEHALYHVTSRGNACQAMAEAYRTYGYRLRETADHVGLQYSTISRRLPQAEEEGTCSQNLTLRLHTNQLAKNLSTFIIEGPTHYPYIRIIPSSVQIV